MTTACAVSTLMFILASGLWLMQVRLRFAAGISGK